MASIATRGRPCPAYAPRSGNRDANTGRALLALQTTPAVLLVRKESDASLSERMWARREVERVPWFRATLPTTTPAPTWICTPWRRLPSFSVSGKLDAENECCRIDERLHSQAMVQRASVTDTWETRCRQGSTVPTAAPAEGWNVAEAPSTREEEKTCSSRWQPPRGRSAASTPCIAGSPRECVWIGRLLHSKKARVPLSSPLPTLCPRRRDDA